jgi:pilus assembly protein Flp/PilA
MMTKAISRFWRDESGVTAIEYGLIAGLLAVVIIAAVTAAGGNLNAIFSLVCTKLNSAVTAGGGTAVACPA